MIVGMVWNFGCGFLRSPLIAHLGKELCVKREGDLINGEKGRRYRMVLLERAR
jgi:hypothetical protein